MRELSSASISTSSASSRVSNVHCVGRCLGRLGPCVATANERNGMGNIGVSRRVSRLIFSCATSNSLGTFTRMTLKYIGRTIHGFVDRRQTFAAVLISADIVIRSWSAEQILGRTKGANLSAMLHACFGKLACFAGQYR